MTTPALNGSAPERWWVWRSSQESKAAGKISVRAAVETLLAVVVYWAVAIVFDTHVHLLTSVFVAPFLLLRSPHSIETGVRWFLDKRFGFDRFPQWRSPAKYAMIAVTSLLAFLVAVALTTWASNRHGASSGFVPAVVVAATGAICVFFSYVVAGAVLVAIAGSPRKPLFEDAFNSLKAINARHYRRYKDAEAAGGNVLGLAAGDNATYAAWFGAIIGAVPTTPREAYLPFFVGMGVGSLLILFAGVFAATGIGLTIRAVVCRFVATFRHLPSGVVQLSENWKESMLVIDSGLTPEFIPGLREEAPEMSLESTIKSIRQEKAWLLRWIAGPVLTVCLFLPASLYRFNLKATAWFWWPLAYLAAPSHLSNDEAERTQWLCWPWTNPIQRMLILFTLFGAIGSIFAFFVNYSLLWVATGVPGLPLVLKVLFAFEWKEIAPWHVAQWIIAVCSGSMLYLAGDAVSHVRAGNMRNYLAKSPWLPTVMNGLYRFRWLATIALLMMAAGSLMLIDPSWEDWLPDRWLKQMKAFYRVE